MSYLDIPRLYFAGHFQADVSTINNDVRHFSNEGFREKYQTMSGGGGWNPEGTGIYRLIDCRITGARLERGSVSTSTEDPVIGMALENSDDHVFGKIVDLDPQQQMVSQIWGMRLRLSDGKEKALFSGEFVPAAFTNLWLRQQTGVRMDQQLGAIFQSVLRAVEWQGSASSRVLDALRAASDDGYLAINLNVYGYGRDPAIPRYTLGRVAGTIGPYQAGEPRHFVMGRQLIAALDPSQDVYPFVPANGVYSFQAKVHADDKILTVDLGNSLQIVDASGALAPVGTLQMGVLKTTDPDALQTTVTPDQVAILGTIDYQRAGWYETTAGIQDFDFSANPWCVANISSRPLALLSPRSDGNYDVRVQETLGGLYVRADDFVCRINTGNTAEVDLYASKYGATLSASLTFGTNSGMMGGTGAGDQPLDPPVTTPVIEDPANGISRPATLGTDGRGKAVLKIQANRLTPANPRGYIEGQLYGVGYGLTERPAGSLDNFWNFISILVFSPFEAPAQPTWYSDIRPILQQYGNLYPIMSKHLVQLDDYASVVEHLKILDLAFSLPIEDPNHMPVTRDLSDSKRAMILKWMSTPGSDGLPLKGDPAMRPPPPPPPTATLSDVTLHLDPLQVAGKTAVMLEYQARRKTTRQS
jgi:hypothetical protein